jgi:hypothetical protein
VERKECSKIINFKYGIIIVAFFIGHDDNSRLTTQQKSTRKRAEYWTVIQHSNKNRLGEGLVREARRFLQKKISVKP